MKKPAKTLKCPVCFMRENDVWLQWDGRKNELYCVKCSYRGDEKLTYSLYADVRKKFKLITTRLTLAQQEKM